MEEEAGAKSNNSDYRICFCLATENLLHKKILSEFIYCICHQTYTKDALVLCRLKLLWKWMEVHFKMMFQFPLGSCTCMFQECIYLCVLDDKLESLFLVNFDDRDLCE